MDDTSPATAVHFRAAQATPAAEPVPNAAPAAAVRADQPVPQEYDLLCEACGYSLIGITSDRCPECGRRFDPMQLPLARVPWLYRYRIGHIRAYVRTAMMILRQPRAFAQEICRPVRLSAQDAASFRRATLRIVIVTAAVAAAAFGIGVFLTVARRPFAPPVGPYVLPGVLLYTAGLIGLYVALHGATDMPTFIWRGLPGAERELAPLHHYASAPLLLVFVLAIECALSILCIRMVQTLQNSYYLAIPRGLVLGAYIAAGLLMFLSIVPIFRTPLVFMKAATGCSRRRMLGLGLYLPVHWVLMLGLGLLIYGLGAVLTSMALPRP